MDDDSSTGFPIVDAPYVIDDTNKQGIIVVLTTFCLICIWVLFGIRTYIRLKVNGPWKWDDTCVAVATVISTARSALVYIEIHRGYGISGELLDDAAIISIGKAVFGDNILYFLAMFFSKCAVLLLCLRLTPKNEHRIAIGAIFVCCALWALSSILLLSINCSPGSPWADLAAKCANIATRWKAICALDIVTEAIIFGCSIFIVNGLRMSWYLKSIVVLAFGIRLPTAIFSGLHLSAVLTEITSPDPTLEGAFTAAWKQVELDFAIAACTFSSLGAFLKPFTKEMGPSRRGTNGEPYGSNSNRSFPMGSLGSGTHNRQGQQRLASQPSIHDEASVMNLRPDVRGGGGTSTAVAFNGSTGERISVDSDDSKSGIIVKQVQWTIDRGSESGEVEGSYQKP